MQPCDAACRLVAIQERLSFLLEAICAQLMRWFIAACLFLHRVDENAWGKLGKLIALFFSVPCFHLSHACFKAAYFLGHRRFALVGRKSALLGGHDLSLQFDNRISKFGSVSH